MPRPLFYVVLVTLIVLWARRFMRSGAGSDSGRPTGKRARGAAGVPSLLVCGACGAQYDPNASGWICPKCGK